MHERDAFHQMHKILSENVKDCKKVVVHCFTGTKNALEDYLTLGIYIGLTGWICDPKRGAHLEELIPIIPLNRLLIETDSPYLLPKNLKVKGRRNEPSFLNEILKKIVEVRKETETEIKEALMKNSLYFFNLLK